MPLAKPRVYLETSFVSYLTGWPSRDIVTAAHQQITREWWQRRGGYELFVSAVVLQEAAGGDPTAARDRLLAVQGIPALELTPEARELARRILAAGIVPAKAVMDALHVGIATVSGMDFLLTWNCVHIANARTRQAVEQIARAAGYETPAICTPEELADDTQDES